MVAGAAILVGAYFAWRHYAMWETTDDAQIDGYINPVSSRVAGYITQVNVDDNEFVKAGTVLVQIDPKDYQVTAESAKASLANDQAQAEASQLTVPVTTVSTTSILSGAQADLITAQAGVEAAQKQYDAALAQLRQTEAHNIKAQHDVERYRLLVAKDEISQQQYDTATATEKAAAAAVEQAKAAAQAAQQQIAQSRGRVAQAEAGVASAQTGPRQIAQTRARALAAQASVKKSQAQLEKAQLELQYTTIVAPIDGIVDKRTAQVGGYVLPGQQLMAVVPLSNIWVTANFKETQLRKMRPGQYVKVHVDAYGRDYNARVQNIAGATGAIFSLLPPENATGNYVKVVQRVPVKIVFDQGQDPNHQLRPGLSVEPSVRVGD
jgi:membrane fusion protein (multidrug efflux system)